MKIILIVECSIHEKICPAGSELEVADFEGEFLISKHRAKLADEKKSKKARKIIKKSKTIS